MNEVRYYIGKKHSGKETGDVVIPVHSGFSLGLGWLSLLVEFIRKIIGRLAYPLPWGLGGWPTFEISECIIPTVLVMPARSKALAPPPEILR